MQLNDDYWSNRYLQGQTGWDLGGPSTPLKEYIDQLTDSSIRILIPGCGNAYEAEYLLSRGFSNLTLIDISEVAVRHLKERFSGRSGVTVLHEDFFKHQGAYDLILEQTFFCALDPSLRNEYVRKMHDLIRPGGKLAGLLFNRDFEGGPPFGGNIEEYRSLFEPLFREVRLEPCYNSVLPRKGTEVFVQLKR